MNVEVLHIAGCPGWQEAGARTRRALDALGLTDTVVHYRIIATSADAQGTRFGGSPTILIDGVDAFASMDRVTELSCRLYPTPEGLREAPTLSQIIEAIRARSA
jgi:hypothetical protein